VQQSPISQLARKGELPGAQIGKGWIFLKEDVLDFIRNRIAAETEKRRATRDSEDDAAGEGKEPSQPVAVLKTRTRRRAPPLLPGLPSTTHYHR
jgi:hypothetical protein